jgi:hypothetical protein
MKLTLGKVFDQLRNDRHATHADIANACNFSESCVWKLSHDWSVRWETVHIALTIGLHIAPGTEPYETCHQLWLSARQERGDKRKPKAGKSTVKAHHVTATNHFRNLVRELDEEETKLVLNAAKRAAARLSQ